MNEEKKHQLRGAYKKALATGGIYAIDCSGNQRRLIKSTVDIAGIKNRFAFAIAINGSPDPALNKECRQYGAQSFTLTVLEELKMKEGQTGAEFAQDIKQLYELWTAQPDAGK